MRLPIPASSAGRVGLVAVNAFAAAHPVVL